MAKQHQNVSRRLDSIELLFGAGDSGQQLIVDFTAGRLAYAGRNRQQDESGSCQRPTA